MSCRRQCQWANSCGNKQLSVTTSKWDTIGVYGDEAMQRFFNEISVEGAAKHSSAAEQLTNRVIFFDSALDFEDLASHSH